MRLRNVLIVWVVLLLVLILVLYFELNALFIWAFVGAFIGSTITMLAIIKRVKIEPYERLVVSRAGQYQDPDVQNGRFFLIRPLEKSVVVNMRPRPYDGGSVGCFTKEGVRLDIGYALQWQVKDPVTFLQNSPGFANTPIALGQIATETLVNTVWQSSLQDVVQRRQKLERAMTFTLRTLPQATNWGIEVVGVNLGEIRVPPNVEEAMARQAAAGLTAEGRKDEVRAAAEALDNLQSALNNPAVLDRAVLLQIMRSLSDAIAQRG